MKRGVWVLKCIVFVALMLALVGFVTQQLWNWLVPVLFNGPTLTFLQALGLLLLSKIFFWSFGKHGGRHQGGPWRHYWKQKWNGMSAEERDELKRKMRERWCTPRGERSEANKDSSIG